mmetsp:Transcript_10443/g.15362  ORF Transcript_10443/g.15362 Transcript_10443/m.15362 type:complete len:106 (-) Transcript_10443:40-357(-)
MVLSGVSCGRALPPNGTIGGVSNPLPVLVFDSTATLATRNLKSSDLRDKKLGAVKAVAKCTVAKRVNAIFGIFIFASSPLCVKLFLTQGKNEIDCYDIDRNRKTS